MTSIEIRGTENIGTKTVYYVLGAHMAVVGVLELVRKAG